ncbi:hypothetical protein SAMN05444483_105194 [Salegentibacter echinorum]|uniref:GH25 family protein n=1 Tax=Salegentibacter echinorum TaxID=1073325 RepID=A0A1M5HKV1_SALEC|nr:hypothetical protein [Salegentibacter echinorum]SHG16599.1 hypothetical protein SAMN05444483_105194 [Salegentibacter echinorum]
MKNIKSFLLAFALMLLNITFVQAHALVIDTGKAGEIGKNHEVRVYYSEFEDRSLEKVADWYSNVADFQLWLVKPTGERIQLKTETGDDVYRANFTPKEQGIHRLEISHIAEDPGDGTDYQFNAFAQVIVGSKKETSVVTAESPELILLEDFESKQPGKKQLKTYFKGKLKEGVTVTIFYPSGKTEDLKSNVAGIVEVDFSEKGNYFFEATTYHPEEKGNTQKAPYKSVWRVATQKLVQE